MTAGRVTVTALALTLALAACSAVETAVDFATLERSDSGNDHLLCAADLCRAEADGPAPVFEATADEIRAAIRAVAAGESRVEELATVSTDAQLVFVQRSLIFRYPDTIRLQVEPLDDGRAALLVYSRSAYGESDFGVNRARVERWVAAITDRLS